MVLVIALVGVLTLSLAHAQQPSTLRADIVSIKDGDYPNARALVNLDDRSGAAIAGLKTADFTATVDGKPAAVVSADLASSQNILLDVLFVIDTSGSMGGEPIARAKEAAKGFLTGLVPGDRVALFSFADQVQSVQDYTTDRKAMTDAIDGLVARGNTALYQATANTAIKVNTSVASRRAVIFLSDGAQDGVPLTIGRDQAIGAAGGIGVPFFTIGEGRDIDRAYLKQLAEVTHGRYLEAPDPKDLSALYAGVGQLLHSQYIVSFDASAAVATGSQVSIGVAHSGSSVIAAAAYTPGAGFFPVPITIKGLAAGESLTTARTITVDAGASGAGTRVSFHVDGVRVFETVDPPYAWMFDPRSFTGGSHVLSVGAQTGGRSSEASVQFSSVVPVIVPAAGGGSSTPLVFIGAAVGAIIAIIVFVVARVRVARRGDAPDIGRVVPFAKPILTRGGPADAPDDSAPDEAVGEALGILISRAGSDLGSEYSVGASPVSIGSGARCAVRVPDPELTAEEARIWIRKGQLMVHKMTRLTAMVTDGSSGGWQILESGDTFAIGQHTFEFRLLPPPLAGEETVPPSVRRAPEPPARPSTQMPSSSVSELMPRSD